MPIQDQTVENHPNGSLGASEKLLKIPSQQLNGKFTEKKVEEEEEDEVTPTADVVVPLDGKYNIKEELMLMVFKQFWLIRNINRKHKMFALFKNTNIMLK